MSRFLFAYGTLHPRYAPAEIAPFAAKLTPIGEGFAYGVLYDLGGYPGAILDPSSQQTIAGTVFQLPDEPQILDELDRYEECDPAAPDTSLFVRVLHSVALATSGTLQCWIYVWKGDPTSATVIPSGRFRSGSPGAISESNA